MQELSQDWKPRFHRRLRAWYRRNRRVLPWRETREPYRVWVSEVMLQQTQVATVRDYFTRFVERLPTVEALAAADEQEVFRLWEGLGYYRRARQLHAAARAIVEEYGGEFPSGVDDLLRLPGIGRYTAGAIASIAFDRPAAILEANTERLYARLMGYRGDPTTSEGKQALWSIAESLVPRRGAGEFNQAVMDLGSLVCTPREPRCAACPVAVLCNAHLQNMTDRIPPRKRRHAYESVHEAVVVVRERGSVLLRQCGERERWAGLWDFPRVTVEPANGETVEAVIARKVRERFGASIEPEELLATIKHGVTRFRITLDCYAARIRKGRVGRSGENRLEWIAIGELHHVPLSTTGRKIAELIETR